MRRAGWKGRGVRCPRPTVDRELLHPDHIPVSDWEDYDCVDPGVRLGWRRWCRTALYHGALRRGYRRRTPVL